MRSLNSQQPPVWQKLQQQQQEQPPLQRHRQYQQEMSGSRRGSVKTKNDSPRSSQLGSSRGVGNAEDDITKCSSYSSTAKMTSSSTPLLSATTTATATTTDEDNVSPNDLVSQLDRLGQFLERRDAMERQQQQTPRGRGDELRSMSDSELDFHLENVRKALTHQKLNQRA